MPVVFQKQKLVVPAHRKFSPMRSCFIRSQCDEETKFNPCQFVLLRCLIMFSISISYKTCVCNKNCFSYFILNFNLILNGVIDVFTLFS